MNFFGNKNKQFTLIYEESNFIIYKTSIKDLFIKYNVKNWSKNRPPDLIRVEQIKEKYNSDNTNFIDGMIHGFIENNNDLIIYDGIHRLLSGKDIDRNIFIILKIIQIGCDENYIVNEFKKINSSVSIPFIYLQNDSELKIHIFNSIMNKMSKKFPNCQSPSRNHWKCNFNRDSFIENILQNIIFNHQLPNIDSIIFEIILGINEKSKKYIKENNIDVYKKCYTNNFFLMYFTNDTLISYINNSSLLN